MRYALVMICFVHALVCAAGVPTPLSGEERERFTARHHSIRKRLIETGGIPDPAEMKLTVKAEFTTHFKKLVEVVRVYDGEVTTAFERSRGTLIRVLARGASLRRAGETSKGVTYRSSLPRSRVEELLRKYFLAVEYGEPPAAGGLDENSLQYCLDASGNGREIDPSEEIFAFWPRTYVGFLFRDDHTAVAISAVDGAFKTYGKYHGSYLPPTVEVKTTEDQAVETAKKVTAEEIRKQAAFDRDKKIKLNDGRLFISKDAYAEAIQEERQRLKGQADEFAVFDGVVPILEEAPQLLIVNPNYCYTDKHAGKNKDYWSPKTRLAWVVKLGYALRTPEGEVRGCLAMEVWIDAATAELCGGVVPY
jgi:hypothetical protein